MFTGVVEVLGGLLLGTRWTGRYGAVMLAATMAGAAMAHLTVLHDPVAAIVPLVLGGIAVAVGLQEPVIRHSRAHGARWHARRNVAIASLDAPSGVLDRARSLIPK